MSGKTIQISKDSLQAVLSDFDAVRYDIGVGADTSDEDSSLKRCQGEAKQEAEHLFKLFHDTKEELNMLANGSREFFSGVLEATKQHDKDMANAVDTKLA